MDLDSITDTLWVVSSRARVVNISPLKYNLWLSRASSYVDSMAVWDYYRFVYIASSIRDIYHKVIMLVNVSEIKRKKKFSGKFYDISGRRTLSPRRKGVYFLVGNGGVKKIIVRIYTL